MDKRTLYGNIYAFCMGDGGVYRRKYKGKYTGNAYFVANNIAKNMDYITWRASVLEEVTSVKVVDVSKYNSRGKQPLMRTETKAHPIFTKLWNRLYSTGRKGIDPHQLKFMSWSFLAILYMDDGSCYVDKRCNATPRVQIATKNYTYPENMAIKFAIKEKLGIEFKVHRHTYRDRIYWYLALPARYYDTFRSGVEPYIFDSFRYKIPDNTNTWTTQI